MYLILQPADRDTLVYYVIHPVHSVALEEIVQVNVTKLVLMKNVTMSMAVFKIPGVQSNQ